ncbi:unnamed protein product [Parajaminaea phylloscopi]
MGQPATAGIIVAAIFVSIAALYLGYRGYVKWHRYRNKPTDSELPPIREPLTPYTASPSGQPNSSVYGDTWRTAGTASRASLKGAGGSIYGQLSPDFGPASRRPSLGAFPTGNSPDSAPTSPFAMPADTQFPAAAAASPSSDTIAQHRMSSASTMTLKRTYAGSVYKGSSSMSMTPPLSPTQKRDSYLPHSPYNRDSIHIVPPQPLGVGFGSMAMATDERTLAFSKTSGIGSGEDTFSSGLVWGSKSTPAELSASGAPERTLSPTHSVSSSSQGWSASVGRDQLHRYLQEGPARVQSGRLASASETDAPQSRPRSPAAAGSLSGTDSAANTHRSYVPGSSMHSSRASSITSGGFPNGPTFTSRQSPLQTLSLRGSVDGQQAPLSVVRSPPASGWPESADRMRNDSARSQQGATPANSSPIMAPFRTTHPDSSGEHQVHPGAAGRSREPDTSDMPRDPRNDTPDLASRSGSGTSGSDHTNVPATPGDGAAGGIAGRQIMVGKDGTLVVSDDRTADPPSHPLR